MYTSCLSLVGLCASEILDTSCLSLVGLCVSEILDTTRIQVVYLLWAYVSLKYWTLHLHRPGGEMASTLASHADDQGSILFL